MLLKDHEQKPTWSSKRAQRCLSFAVIFTLILLIGLTSHNSWPRKAELTLSKMRPYTYGSTPEAGRPTLPFEDNSLRKSTENPFFDVPYAEDSGYEYDDVAQETIEPRDLETESREELETREREIILR